MISVLNCLDGRIRPRLRYRLVDALRAGRVVAVAADRGYCLALSGLAGAMAERLAKLNSIEAVSLVLADSSQAADWCVGLPASIRRMLRRAWPGGLIVEVPRSDRSLIGQLPAQTQHLLQHDGALRLHIPRLSHAQELAQTLGEPLVLAQPKPPMLSAQAIAELWSELVSVLLDVGPLTVAPAESVIRICPNAPNGYELISVGAISADQLQQLSACLVVFVCTGNTCRSPLAEGICKQLLAQQLGCSPEELPQRGYLITSAGTAAIDGEPASELTIATAEQMGIDLSQHRSRLLTAHLAQAADMLVAMTRGHATTISASYQPGVPPRLLCGYNKDIVDPIGGDLAIYQQCAATIREHMTTLVAELHRA